MNESSSSTFLFSILDFCHSNRYIVWYLVFNLQIPNDMMLIIFSYAYLLIVYLFWWHSDLLTIFNWVFLFSYCWALRVPCIFWIPILHQIYVLQRFFFSFWLVLCFSFCHYQDACSSVVTNNQVKKSSFSICLRAFVRNGFREVLENYLAKWIGL